MRVILPFLVRFNRQKGFYLMTSLAWPSTVSTERQVEIDMILLTRPHKLQLLNAMCFSF